MVKKRIAIGLSLAVAIGVIGYGGLVLLVGMQADAMWELQTRAGDALTRGDCDGLADTWLEEKEQEEFLGLSEWLERKVRSRFAEAHPIDDIEDLEALADEGATIEVARMQCVDFGHEKSVWMANQILDGVGMSPMRAGDVSEDTKQCNRSWLARPVETSQRARSSKNYSRAIESCLGSKYLFKRRLDIRRSCSDLYDAKIRDMMKIVEGMHEQGELATEPCSELRVDPRLS